MVLVVKSSVGCFELYVSVLAYDRKKAYWNKCAVKTWIVRSNLSTAISLVDVIALVRRAMLHEKL